MGTFHVVQEGPVNALALNRDFTQVAIGGRNVFKVYAIEEDRFKELCNLRASKHLNLSFSCNDVSWSSTDDHYLATAATNGHVCVWNLTKMGKAMQEQDYQDHKRTVHKVNFHASEPNKLISGSQDGTMRYFDIRVKTAVAVFYSNTESIRDVQFSPHNPYMFSAVSENGSVQLWDVRKTDKCQQQYTAHSGPIFACDWHPDINWLATASRDKTIKVWDLTTKPTLEYTIHTIASIGHVKWRPQYKYHIASCALVVDCSINIWDVRRPYIPFAAFNEHKDIASGVAWKGDPNTFLSSGRDCTLFQHSFDDASRPASKANPQGISINNKGEVLYAYKVNVNCNTMLKTPIGVMSRKSSNTQIADQFHLASSLMHQFESTLNDEKQESFSFIGLAKDYVLNGRSLSEMCEHNSGVAKKYGKNQISIIWKIVKSMYGEEFFQNSVNALNRDDLSHSNIITNSNNIGLDHTVDNDQKSRGGDTPAAQFSDETETEDQVDHIAIYNNGFPTYLNYSTGLPKGDFSFGENELDMELDNVITDYRCNYRNYSPLILQQQSNNNNNHQQQQQQQHLQQNQQHLDWQIPNEAFHIRHEIRDRSPPSSEQLRNNNNNSPELLNDVQQTIIDEHQQQHQHHQQQSQQQTTLLTITCLPKIPVFNPSNIVIEALKHHALLGDIQTSVCILIVLGEQRKCLADLDENVQEHWLLGYIELLSRYQLWNIVTQIIKLSWIPQVGQLNQQSTRFITNCCKCSKPLQRIGWLCDRCHSFQYGLCSVCHQVVKGLYAWCQGCSHGGHLQHMKQWLSVHKTCPTGCGHKCEYR